MLGTGFILPECVLYARMINTMKNSDPISDKLCDIKIQIKMVVGKYQAMNEMRGEKHFDMKIKDEDDGDQRAKER